MSFSRQPCLFIWPKYHSFFVLLFSYSDFGLTLNSSEWTHSSSFSPWNSEYPFNNFSFQNLSLHFLCWHSLPMLHVGKLQLHKFVFLEVWSVCIYLLPARYFSSFSIFQCLNRFSLYNLINITIISDGILLLLVYYKAMVGDPRRSSCLGGCH